jgi:hypothetical protein
MLENLQKDMKFFGSLAVLELIQLSLGLVQVFVSYASMCCIIFLFCTIKVVYDQGKNQKEPQEKACSHLNILTFLRELRTF